MESLLFFEEFGMVSGITGIAALIIAGFFYIQIHRIKTKPQATTAASEQFQTILNGYIAVIETLQDELERLKVKLLLLEQEQVACEKRNDELMIELNELKSRFDSIGK